MIKKALSKIRKPKEAIPMRNPWLDIPHDCNWLSASDGTEWVCGDCGLRKPA